MNKAFTKEQDGDADDDEDAAAALPPLPAGSKNYLTPQGYARLRAELMALIDVDRPKVVEIVHWAASNGDRSENGDYIYGKRRLREIDRRIRFLTKRLEAAEIVEPSAQSTERVLFGAYVTVERTDSDDETLAKPRTYRIVGIDETNVSKGEISWISPMARALLGAKSGDIVSLRTPRGDEELQILKIRYV